MDKITIVAARLLHATVGCRDMHFQIKAKKREDAPIICGGRRIRLLVATKTVPVYIRPNSEGTQSQLKIRKTSE